jgi:hypothetical protein
MIMGKVIDFPKPETKTETKTEKFKRQVKEELWKAKDFVIRNKETILLAAPVVVGVVTVVVKTVGKNVNLRKEERIKNQYCYDRSLGHYWALRRNLSNQEWTEIDRRKTSGERLADILSELKVLR